MKKNSNLLPKMVRGTICSQKVRCGKPNCKCASGDLHGPYFYHFERIGRVLKKRYVKPTELERLRGFVTSRQENERRARAIALTEQRHWSQLSEELRASEKLITEWRKSQHGQ